MHSVGRIKIILDMRRAKAKDKSKQAQGFLDECLVLIFYNIIIIYTVTLFFL